MISTVFIFSIIRI